MTRPPALVESLVSALQADTYHFVYGTPKEQNEKVESFDFTAKPGIAMLDTPIQTDNANSKTNVQMATTPLTVFFAYPVELDTTKAQRDVFIQKAWDAAREFSLRLNAVSFELSNWKYFDVDNYQSRRYDLNLCGCLLTISYTIKDAGSTCLT